MDAESVASSRSRRSAGVGGRREGNSNVALCRLRRLERELDDEMRKRRAAENAVKALVRERRLREQAQSKTSAARHQLQAVLTSICDVLKDPNNSGLLNKTKYQRRKHDAAHLELSRSHHSAEMPHSFLDALACAADDGDPNRSYRTNLCHDYKGNIHFVGRTLRPRSAPGGSMGGSRGMLPTMC